MRRCVWSRNIKNGCSIYIYDISRLRVKHQATSTRGSRGMAPCTHWLGTQWRPVFGLKTQPFYPQISAFITHWTGGWVEPRDGLDISGKRMSIICFLPGNSLTSEFYMPTFWNTLSHLHRQVAILITYPPMKMEQTQCSETSAYKIQTPE